MSLNHKINIFLENKKWLDKKIFKSKKGIDNFIYHLSQITINECFSGLRPIPTTFAPSLCNQKASQEPLKPVEPVTKTFVFL